MFTDLFWLGFAAFIPLVRQQDSGSESLSSDWIPGLLLIVCIVLGSAGWHLRRRRRHRRA